MIDPKSAHVLVEWYETWDLLLISYVWNHLKFVSCLCVFVFVWVQRASLRRLVVLLGHRLLECPHHQKKEYLLYTQCRKWKEKKIVFLSGSKSKSSSLSTGMISVFVKIHKIWEPKYFCSCFFLKKYVESVYTNNLSLWQLMHKTP